MSSRTFTGAKRVTIDVRVVVCLLALLGLTACVAVTQMPGAGGLVCTPGEHGGRPGDGDADTNAIQAAINACAGRDGRVVLAAGQWETGLIRLGSDMEFHLAEGAVLSLIPDIELFPEVDVTTDPDDPDDVRTALLGFGVKNLTISGRGRIHGNGPAFWDPDFYTSGLARPSLPRPAPTLALSDCSGVTLRDFEMTDLPAYAIRFRNCDGVRAEALTISNDPRSPNTDGIQISDTSNVVISGVDIRTGDDAIVLKSHDRIIRNVLVEDSYLESDDGALKFGTGSRQGVQDSVFRDLTIANARYGIAIFMLDGGRHANNRFENINIRTGGRHNRTYPIYMDIDRRTADRPLGEIEGVVFDGIEIDTAGASLISGNPDAPIGNLTLRNIQVTLPDTLEDLNRSGGKPRGNVTIETQPGSVDHSRTPAHFVFAHVDGLTLEAIEINAGANRHDRSGYALIYVTTRQTPDITIRSLVR